MDWGTIKGWNAAPGAPADWNPARGGECGALPIRATTHADGSVAHCESAWLPSAEDLELLNAGHPIVFRVVGWQVPVALYVDPFTP